MQEEMNKKILTHRSQDLIINQQNCKLANHYL